MMAWDGSKTGSGGRARVKLFATSLFAFSVHLLGSNLAIVILLRLSFFPFSLFLIDGMMLSWYLHGCVHPIVFRL